VDRAEDVLVALADVGPAADGVRAMIGGYLAWARGDRSDAVKLFESAAATLLGHHDARDVVEALVGVAANTPEPAAREAVLAQLDEVARRAGVTLLPRERALLEDR
jgi:hypothetical protein